MFNTDQTITITRDSWEYLPDAIKRSRDGQHFLLTAPCLSVLGSPIGVWKRVTITYHAPKS